MHQESPQVLDIPPLAARWQGLLKENPKLRIRDAAESLAVSEMALVALDCGRNVTRLEADWGEFIKRLPDLGRVMVLTRNDHAVHERKGVFGNIRVAGPMGLVLNTEIDLRIFLNRWTHGFAVTTDRGDHDLLSFQFFDAAGDAIHKVYLTDDSDIAAYNGLVSEFASPNQSANVETKLITEDTDFLPDADVDVAGLRDGWRALQDVHDFMALLRKFKVARTQSLRLAGPEFCRRVSNASLWALLNDVAGRSFPIMVFVGNRGCIQIHSGPVTNIKRFDEWVNVLDPDFNLHLREDRIAETWVVQKPTVDGPVTSLELYDAAGDSIATLFSVRGEGNPENPDWRNMLAALSDA